MSTKIQIKVKPKYKDLQINGVDLQVFPDGSIWRYAEVKNQFYPQPGWVLIDASCLDNNGYRRIKCNGKKVLAHRIIYLAFNPTWDIADVSAKNQIDHIDNNKLNNNISNLRIATNGQNTRNVKTSRANTSGHKGFTYAYKRGRWYWKFEVMFNRKSHERSRIIYTNLGKQDKKIVQEQFPFPQDFLDDCRAFREQLHGDFTCH